MLKAKRPAVSGRALTRMYGFQEHRDLINKCRMAIDKRRGWDFAAKVTQKSEAS